MQRSNSGVRAVALREVVNPRIGQPADLGDLLQPTLDGETRELASKFVDDSGVEPGGGLHAHGARSTGIPVSSQGPRTGTSIGYGGTVRRMSCDPIREYIMATARRESARAQR